MNEKRESDGRILLTLAMWEGTEEQEGKESLGVINLCIIGLVMKSMYCFLKPSNEDNDLE